VVTASTAEQHEAPPAGHGHDHPRGHGPEPTAHGHHHDKHAGPDPEMFRRLFWWNLILAVPVVVFAPMILDWFG
jgi:Cu2+-exporting ATPase